MLCYNWMFEDLWPILNNIEFLPDVGLDCGKGYGQIWRCRSCCKVKDSGLIVTPYV
jgi:hypothetical protein